MRDGLWTISEIVSWLAREYNDAANPVNRTIEEWDGVKAILDCRLGMRVKMTTLCPFL